MWQNLLGLSDLENGFIISIEFSISKMSHSNFSKFLISFFEAANKLNEENEIIIVMRISFFIIIFLFRVELKLPQTPLAVASWVGNTNYFCNILFNYNPNRMNIAYNHFGLYMDLCCPRKNNYLKKNYRDLSCNDPGSRFRMMCNIRWPIHLLVH